MGGTETQISSPGSPTGCAELDSSHTGIMIHYQSIANITDV